MVGSALWVKSYPFPKEVSALADLGSQNIGIEIFLGSDQEKSEECLRICRDEYPRLGIELFCYQDEEKRKGEIIYDSLSRNEIIRELSREYLFRSLDLGLKYGATHLQFDGNDGYQFKPGQIMASEMIKEAIERKKGLLAEIQQRYGAFPVYFENTIPIDDHSPELIFSLTGHRLSDFYTHGLPLEYDLAHHAIALNVYSRADEFRFPLNEEELKLAKMVQEIGITGVIVEELKNIAEIYFVQFDNASPFVLQTTSDTAPEDSRRALIDLECVLPILLQKSKNIAPEVADKDFIQRPNLRNWIKKLQEMLIA